MPQQTLKYPKTPTNRVKRLGDRGNYDAETIHGIVNSTQVVHVSFQPGPDEFPVILPMIGQMGSFDNPSASIKEPLDLYLHGHVSARIMNIAKATEATLKVCVCATKIDGLVLSYSPFNHSYNYRSAVIFGTAELVTEKDEKMWALELITNSVVPERWDHTRFPDNAEMTSTNVLRVRVESASAKIRCGGPHDDKKDMENPEVVNNVWTGVVPVYETFGEPTPAPHNKVEKVPEYIDRYLAERSKGDREFAIAAMEEPTETEHAKE